MCKRDPSILVILPLTEECPDCPKANWMLYGDRDQSRARYDVIYLEKNSRPIGSFVFLPLEGGLLWVDGEDGHVVSDGTTLTHNGDPVAYVRMGGHCSYVVIMAPGVEVNNWLGDFYLNNRRPRPWRVTVSQYRNSLYE